MKEILNQSVTLREKRPPESGWQLQRPNHTQVYEYPDLRCGRKQNSEKPDEVLILPAGIKIPPEPAEDKTKQNQSESAQKKSQSVWYVLLQTPDHPKPGEFRLSRVYNTWLFAHTKSWARHLARKAEAEGHTVIDIFKGTKAHISHKFGGLK